MGRTRRLEGAPFCRLADGREEGAAAGLVFGTYLHGLFDTGELTQRLAEWLARRRGLVPVPDRPEHYGLHRQQQYDLLAEAVRAHLDLDAIYRAMEGSEYGA